VYHHGVFCITGAGSLHLCYDFIGWAAAAIPMRYWWVNQNQTYRHEVAGGYLWSPKRMRNGDSNPFYDFMR
jgi:hypothetical protein